MLPGSSEVHVWRARLDVEQSIVERRLAVLDVNERLRASQFLSVTGRQRFIVAHGLLREILARYLTAEPERLAFRCNEYGKPELDGSYAYADLRFNMSHTGGMALYAVTCGRELGVDIEALSASVATAKIAEQFFSPSEVAALGRLPARLQRQAFFACWTRKEAFIKARGSGLSMPLDRFTVSVAPNEPARLLAVDPSSELRRWAMASLSVGSGYEAAVVVEGHDWRLKCLEWRDPLRTLGPRSIAY